MDTARSFIASPNNMPLNKQTLDIVDPFRVARLVEPIGSPSARIGIIGEAPGRQEEMAGVPFIGPSGILLTNALAKAGISKDECYISNVIKHRPEDINSLLVGSRRGVVTTPEYDAYENSLREELEATDCEVFVAAGNIALYALTRKWNIEDQRGSLLPCTLIPGRRVLPIIHPAATMHGIYVHRHLIEYDIRKLPLILSNPELWDDTTQYILSPSMQDVLDYLTRCKAAKLVAFDIEVSYGEVSCISFSCDTESAISIPFVESGTAEYFTPPQEATIWQQVAGILENPAIQKVAHNAVFDATFLHDRYGIATRNIHDTMIACGILYPDFKKGLGFVTSIATRFAYYKDEGKEQIMKGGGSGKTFWLYNAKDSIVLMHALPNLLRDLERAGNLGVYEAQRLLIEPLVFMARKGIRIDLAGQKKASTEAKIRLLELEEEAIRLAGRPINLSSPKQLIGYFYEGMNADGFKAKAYTKMGKDTTDEKAITRLISHAKPSISRMATIISEHRKLKKADGTYYEMQFDSDGRLRCSPNPVGTRFGRISTSQTIFGTGGNMQNLPKKFRRFCLPDPGYIFINVDLAQAENRITAYVAQEESMIAAFESGADLHRVTAAGIFGISPEEVTDEGEPTPELYIPAPLAGGKHSQRYYGKRANHALNYGMREGRAALEWEIPLEDARFIVERYHSTYPAIRRWHRRIEAEMGKNRTLTNLYGRRYRFMDAWDNSLLLEANSFIPQSTNADHLNRNGLVPLYYSSEFREAEVLMQVHDSLLFQVPPEIGWRRIAEMVINLKLSLETPLVAHEGTPDERSFVIPADFTIMRNTWEKGVEFKASKWRPEFYDDGELAAHLGAAFIECP